MKILGQYVIFLNGIFGAMRFRIPFFCVLLLLMSSPCWVQAQGDGSVINKGYYRSHDLVGAFLHTRGVGIQYQHAWRKTGFSSRILSFDLLSIKHPKQHKINQAGLDSRGYFFGKINSVGLLRASYGWQNVLFDKDLKRGVRVSYYFLFGPTLGLTKPVFVDYRASGDGSSLEIVQYSVELDNKGEVLGRAPALYRLGSIRPHPGGHAKATLNFEYSGNDALIRAIETGVIFDAFAKRIPIMENTYNHQFYLTLFVGIQIGKRHQ